MATGKVIGRVEVSIGNVRFVDTEGNLRDSGYEGLMYEGEQIYSDDPNALFQIKYLELPEATAYDGIFRVLADGSVIAGLDGNENMFGDDIDFMETAAGGGEEQGSSAFLEEVATDESSLLGFGRGADEAGFGAGDGPAGVASETDEVNIQPTIEDVVLGTGDELIYESVDDNATDGTRDDVTTTLTGTLTAADGDILDTHIFDTGELTVTSPDIDPEAITISSFELTNNDHGDATPNSADFTIVGNFNALGAGETATLTFTYTATDDNILEVNPNESEPATVTIVVTGTNDQPEITNIVAGTQWDTTSSWLIGASTTSNDSSGSGPGEDSDYYDIDGAPEEAINALFNVGDGSVEVRDLDPTSGEDYNPTDGAALKITMNVDAGETVTFNWLFNDAEGYGTNEDDSGPSPAPGEDGGFRDFSFVVIDGVVINLLADTFEEGTQNSGVFTHTFANAGDHEITFGVMNDDDEVVDSSLIVTHISGGMIVDTEAVGHIETLSQGTDIVLGYLSFDNDNWFAADNGVTITGYENDGSVVTPTVNPGGLGIGEDGEDNPQVNDQLHGSGGHSAEAIVFDFDEAYNSATIELSSFHGGRFSSEKVLWTTYKDGEEVDSGIFYAPRDTDTSAFTIHSLEGDFDSIRVEPPLDYRHDSFYVKSLSVLDRIYETHDATDVPGAIDTDEDVYTTFTGVLDNVTDVDVNDTHIYEVVAGTIKVNGESVEDSLVNISFNTETEAWEYTIEGDFNYLDANEVAMITFDYVAIDDSDDNVAGDRPDLDIPHESDTSEAATITVAITGTNDQPVVRDVTRGAEGDLILENVDLNGEDSDEDGILRNDEGEMTISGDLSETLTDADDAEADGDTHTFRIVRHSESSSNELIDIDDIDIDVDRDGTYSVRGDFTALAAGETATITFRYTADDDVDSIGEASKSEEATVSITITGTNDQPVVEDISLNDMSFDNSNWLTDGNGLSISAYDYYGEDAPVNYHSKGLGVNSPGYDKGEINDSRDGAEAIVFDFDDPVSTATLELANIGNHYSSEEVQWIAYKDGEEVDRGTYETPSHNHTSTRSFTIEPEGDFDSLRIEPVYGNGQYDNFYIKSLDATRVIYETNTEVDVRGVDDTHYEAGNTFTGMLSATDDDVNDTHTFHLVQGSVSVDNMPSETVLLGQEGGEALGLDNWGVAIDSHTRELTLDNGVVITTSSDSKALRQYDHEAGHVGEGIGDKDGKGINVDETITVAMAGGFATSATFGFDGLGSHFRPESAQQAKATWVAYNNGVEVASGEVDSATNFLTIDAGVPFDSVEFSTDSDGGSSWELRYVEAEVIPLDVVVNENGEYDIEGDFGYLAAGETATVTFNYIADDNRDDANGEPSESEPKTVTMTITGTNDQPIVENVAFSANETHDDTFYQDGEDNTRGDSEVLLSRAVGVLSAEDDDLTDTHVFNVKDYTASQYYGHGNGGPGQNGDHGDIRFDMVDFYKKGSGGGGSHDSGPLPSPGNGGQGGEPEGVKMMIASEDVDVHNLDVTKLTFFNNNGADSQINFELEGDFNALGVGETATITFKYMANDRGGFGGGHGGGGSHDSHDSHDDSPAAGPGHEPDDGPSNDESSHSEPKLVTITIMGTNDQPVIENIETKHALERGLESVTYGGDRDIALDEISEDPQEGSALKVIVDTAAGETVAFDWNFTSGDWANDTAVVIIDGQIVGRVDTGNANTQGTFSHTFAEAGEHTVTFVVVNDRFDDTGGSSWNAELDVAVNPNSEGVIIDISRYGNVTRIAGGANLDADTDAGIEGLGDFIDLEARSYENAQLFGNIDDIADVTDDDDNDDYSYLAFDDMIIDSDNYVEVSSGDELMTTPIRVSLDAEGNYKVVSSSFDKLGEGESVTITFDVQVQDDSGVGTGTANDESSFSEIKTITMVIHGTNDSPVLGAIAAVNMMETDLQGLPYTPGQAYPEHSYIIGTLPGVETLVTDEDVNDTHEYVEFGQFDGPPFFVNVMDASGAVMGHAQMRLDSEGEYRVFNPSFNNLGIGETATISFDVQVTDGTTGSRGGETDLSNVQTVTLTVSGTNDQPTVNAVNITRTETTGMGEDSFYGLFRGEDEDTNDTLTYGLVNMDVDFLEPGFVSVAYYDGNTYMGHVNIKITTESGSEVDYSNLVRGIQVNGNGFKLVGDFNTLPDGEELKVEFLYNANDGTTARGAYDESNTSDAGIVTLTVIGTEDDALITAKPGHDEGTVTEDGDITAVGHLNIADADAGQAQFEVIDGSAGVTGYGTFTIDADGDWKYVLDQAASQSLADGQRVTETYMVKSEDGTDSHPVVITIVGDNDGPTLETTDGTGAVTEDAAATLTDSGDMAFTDVDLSDTHTVNVVPTSGGTLGTLTASVTEGVDADNGTVTWTYNVANSGVQYLGEGETKVETFDVTVSDGEGGTSTQAVSVTITGTDDAPHVTTSSVISGIEMGSREYTYTNDTDVNIQDAYRHSHGGHPTHHPHNHDGRVTSSIIVADSAAITDLNVSLTLTHTWDNDLDIYLIAPDGTTRVELTTDNGGRYDNYTDTTFDDEASIDIDSWNAQAPFTGTFRPEGDLSDFDGMDMFGTWTLEIIDDARGDTGTLDTWSLNITADTGTPTLTYDQVLEINDVDGGTIDVAALAASLGQDSIDKVELSGRTELDISIADVVDITDGDNELMITSDGGSNDTVTLDTNITVATDQTGTPAGFTTYEGGTGTDSILLTIEDNITVEY